MTDGISEKLESLSPLKRAALVLKKKQAELDAIQSARSEPIAIIGMGCRFPGASHPDAYWQLLRDGVDAVTEYPSERFDVDAWFDPDPEAPGKLYARHGGFLSEIDRFEPQFFGISPREAQAMDPQQRLVLEVGWEALENAGLAPDTLEDKSVGIFIGVIESGYGLLQFSGDPERISAHTGTGSNLSFVAGRLSYVLGSRGPVFNVDTACSSSLVAAHLACQSLRAGESELAIMGGVHVIVSPSMTVFLSRTQALSPDGRCKAFDASADGFSRGEGCGIVVLKRLSDAIADGDNVLAVIRGSAINHDGASGGLTVPSEQAQEKLVRQAMEDARITPDQVSYIEAHGTGTSLGDPIEVGALGAVFGKDHSQDSPLVIGSAKTNLAHLESAAGIAGLIKIVLSLQHETIPPHLHFKEPNPLIDWENLPFRVPVERQPWLRGEKSRIAGVSGFGMSGTNAHVILEEAPAADGPLPTAGMEHPFHLLTLSAKSIDALRELAGKYAIWLEAHPEIPFADVCFTAYTGRAHLTHRLALAAASPVEARERLHGADYTIGVFEGKEPNVAFLFTGQGSQYVGMGRGLYESEPRFREILDRCDAILRPLEVPLLDLLYADDADPEALNRTIYTQPALFSLEVALARLWQSWGVQPNAVMGHSVGEYVAACIAGVFSLEDALKLIAARGRLMQTLCEPGDMLALQASESEALALIAPFSGEISLAAINGPLSVVVSGKPAAMEVLKTALVEKDVKAKALSVSHAFHSAMMEPMLAEFEKVAGSVTYAEPGIPLCSNVTGKMVGAFEVANPAYWIGHVREPVRFAAGVKTLHGEGIDTFLEVGPRPSLLGMAGDCLPDDADIGWLPSLREGQDDWRQLLSSLGGWYARGGAVDWRGLEGENTRRKVSLPTYPFQRSRYWIDTARSGRRAGGERPLHPLLGDKIALSTADNTYFQSEIEFFSAPWLSDHRIFGTVAFPATALLEMASAAGAEVFRDPDAGARPAPLQMTDIRFEGALPLPEEANTTCQLVLSPREQGFGFQVFSLEAKDKWSARVTGGLAVNQGPEAPGVVDLVALLAQCPIERPIAEHYRECRERGLDYGPGFQGLKQLFRGEGVALGKIEAPESLAERVERYRLHPALLDAALQTIPLPPEAAGELYLPVSIGAFSLYTEVRSDNRFWSFARVTESEEERLTADVSLFDESGVAVAEIQGLTFGRVDLDIIWRDFKKQSDDLYEIAWREIPGRARESEAGEEEAGSWLILADSGGFGEELAARLEGQGNRCVLAYASTVFGNHTDTGRSPPQDGNTHTLDPTDPTAFPRLLQDAFPPDAPPPQGIVYLWALDAPDTLALTPETLMTAQDLVVGGALHLVQATIGQGQTAGLWLVTRDAVAVVREGDTDAYQTMGALGEGNANHGPEPALSLAQAPLWGFGRSLALENPELWGGIIDSPDVDDLLAEIGAGMGAVSAPGEREDQVAYRDGRRYVARLGRVRLSASEPVSLRPDGSYLITGGLGELGIEAARRMAGQGAGCLILVDRNEPSARMREVLREWEEAATRVVVLWIDISDRVQVADLFARIDAEMPPLKGIVHAAGVMDEGMLPQQDLARFRKVMAPKVAGSWHLHTLTRDRDLDFFISFSSITSLLGGLGQSGDIAANAFLDALAGYRRAVDLPALAIGWGIWAKGALETEESGKRRERWAAAGTRPLEPEEGVLFLERLMGQTEIARVGVCPVDWQLFLQRFPGMSAFLSEVREAASDPLSVSVDLVGELQAIPSWDRRDYLFNHVRTEFNKVLGFPPSQSLDSRKGFSDLGMDSLMSVELRKRLQAGLEYSLPPTLLFDYPRLDVLVDYFFDEVLALDSWEDAAVEETEGACAGETNNEAEDEAIWDKLEEFSDEELEALLDKKLGNE